MNYQPKTPFIEVGEKDAPEGIKLLDQSELDNINETTVKTNGLYATLYGRRVAFTRPWFWAPSWK